MNRRDALTGLLAAGAAFTATGAASSRAAATAWPRDFVWGVATAGHQIEGNSVASDYWLLENLPVTDFADRSGDACDSWTRWREDVALVAALGLNCYRFSLEWARIEPERGRYSNAALEQYRRLCAACRDAGIMPIVTFHHFVSPRWFAAAGGWEARDAPEAFARYVSRAARSVGDLIGAACTMNEPNAQVTSFVMRDARPSPREPAMLEEARRLTGSAQFGAYFMGDAFRVRDACLKAHRLATAAIKDAVPGLKTGLTLALQDLRAGSGGEVRRQRIFDEARLPFYEACAQDDFVGPQPYNRYVVGADGYLASAPDVPRNRSGVDASPDVIAAVLREVHAHCGAPMLVTEHGIDTEDDSLRERHLRASLEHLHGAIDAGLPVLGYIHWSLLDNFEWRTGYAAKFGLHAVNRDTFERTAKPSAAAYRALVRRARARRLQRLPGVP